MSDMLRENISLWQERIGNNSAKLGGAEICAVTKTVDVATINLAAGCGIRTIGENRVQEYLSKSDHLDPSFDVHIIGALQTNKVRQIVGKVAMIQSLDREALAVEINDRALKAGVVVPTLVQVNIAREPQKSGLDEEALLPFLRKCSEWHGLRVEGLMAIMPFVDDPEEIRPYFKRMRGWFDRLRDSELQNVHMNTLSMGMSGDCLVAAEEGATMVRLGRALFGARPIRRENTDSVR